MPKMKTKSSAKKRFKLTGTGKIKRKHAFKSHILTKKSKKSLNLYVSNKDVLEIAMTIGNCQLGSRWCNWFSAQFYLQPTM